MLEKKKNGDLKQEKMKGVQFANVNWEQEEAKALQGHHRREEKRVSRDFRKSESICMFALGISSPLVS